VMWEDIGLSYTISGSTLVVKLSNQANGRLNADAIRVERVGELASLMTSTSSAGASWVPLTQQKLSMVIGGTRHFTDLFKGSEANLHRKYPWINYGGDEGALTRLEPILTLGSEIGKA